MNWSLWSIHYVMSSFRINKMEPEPQFSFDFPLLCSWSSETIKTICQMPLDLIKIENIINELLFSLDLTHSWSFLWRNRTKSGLSFFKWRADKIYWSNISKSIDLGKLEIIIYAGTLVNSIFLCVKSSHPYFTYSVLASEKL